MCIFIFVCLSEVIVIEVVDHKHTISSVILFTLQGHIISVDKSTVHGGRRNFLKWSRIQPQKVFRMMQNVYKIYQISFERRDWNSIDRSWMHTTIQISHEHIAQCHGSCVQLYSRPRRRCKKFKPTEIVFKTMQKCL